jgi:DNA-binding NarL/FixJ family response regulator
MAGSGQDVSSPPTRLGALPVMTDGWPATRFGDETLTRREVEVAGLVSQGLANKSVAILLGVVEGTVKIHLHSIYRKLRVANRTGLIQSAIANRR